MQARRYNKGKTRFELVSDRGLRALADVYTRGAHAYTIYRDKEGREIKGRDVPLSEVGEFEIVDSGDNNWRRGMPWSEVLGCAKRHIQAFSEGEDFDELGTLHLANAAWNLLTLIDFYGSYPQGDDRRQWFKKPLKRVWLDLDGVVCDMEHHFLRYLELPLDHPTDWDDWRFRENLSKVAYDDTFWATMPPACDPSKICYPISGYCTSRHCRDEIIEDWLNKNGFPKAPVINIVQNGKIKQTKAEALAGKCDFFIDDSIRNFMDLNAAGIPCYLATRPHNSKYDVGYRRVSGLIEFLDRIKQVV